MKWTPEAEKAIKKVPFFVRKRVRLRVENETKDKGKTRITPDDVKATKAAYLSNMSSEVKGYQMDTCFGSEGCPNRANNSDRIIGKIEAIFRERKQADWTRIWCLPLTKLRNPLKSTFQNPWVLCLMNWVIRL